MALLSLLFDRPQKFRINVPDSADFTSSRELLILDAAETIVHQNDAEPTLNPVEEGIDVTDHFDVKPKVLSFDGIISEAPIKLEDVLLGNVAGLAGNVVGGAVGGLGGAVVTTGLSALGGLLMNKEKDRAKEGMSAMLELQEKAIMCDIVTGLRTYKNMVLTSFQPTETASIGKSLSFSATFKEIRIVKSEQITLPQQVLDALVAPSATSNLNQGKKAAPNADNATSGKGETFLVKGGFPGAS